MASAIRVLLQTLFQYGDVFSTETEFYGGRVGRVITKCNLIICRVGRGWIR